MIVITFKTSSRSMSSESHFIHIFVISPHPTEFRELSGSHGRGDASSKMSRSFSLPSTPKERSSGMESELSLRQVQSEMKKRRQALHGMGEFSS